MTALGASQPGTERAAKIAYVVRIAVTAALALMALRFVWTYRTIRIPEWNDQMAPTLSPGEKVIVHPGKRGASQFGRGELLVYAVRAVDGVSLRFGRVAALPGDRVDRGGEGSAGVLVNGAPPADAPVVLSPAEPQSDDTGGEAPARVHVPDGTVYVLNDNTTSTLSDSRTLGPIDERAIQGKVVMPLAW
jgi:signal peptidase I